MTGFSPKTGKVTVLAAVLWSIVPLPRERSCAAPLKEAINVGEIGATTGAEASYGVATHQGVAMAVREINRTGGIRGKRLRIIQIDSKGTTEAAVAAAGRLIKEEGVVALIGETASSRSLAIAAVAQQARIPMISPSATSPKVTEAGSYIFRVCFTDPFQGFAMAKFARLSLKFDRIAVMYDATDSYSNGLAEYFSRTFSELGGKVVGQETYKSGDIDFKKQLTALASAGSQAIFVPGYYSEVGLISRQARSVGIKLPLLGGDGWDSPNLLKVSGKSIEGGYFSNHFSAEGGSPAGKNFARQFKKRYREEPSGLAAMGYDATMVLADAMRRATAVKPEAVRDALAETVNFPGVTGSITIDDKRNAVKPAVIMRIKNGKFVYESTIRSG